MYAAIRQGKAKTSMAEELARRIKEGAIPIISDVEGLMAYYVVYAPNDAVTAILESFPPRSVALAVRRGRSRSPTATSGWRSLRGAASTSRMSSTSGSGR